MSDNPDYSHLPLLEFSYSESPFDGFIQECETSKTEPTLEAWKRWWSHSVQMAVDTYLGQFKA